LDGWSSELGEELTIELMGSMSMVDVGPPTTKFDEYQAQIHNQLSKTNDGTVPVSPERERSLK
jgi:hypothetical protein